MDWQTLFNIGGLVLTAIVGGYVRFVQGQLDKARSETASAQLTMTEFRIEVAKNYVTHSDLRKIEDTLVRIEAKLDAKADK